MSLLDFTPEQKQEFIREQFAKVSEQINRFIAILNLPFF